MVPPGQVCAILLAAGRSQRFGTADKLLASIDDAPLVSHIARRLQTMRFGGLVAVCSNNQVSQLLTDAGFAVMHNPMPQAGLSHSLVLGINAVPPELGVALICLADMPRVSVQHLTALLDAFDPAIAPIVASSREGQAMPPALFARSQFAALESLTGDRGARDLLRTARLVSANPLELIDFDRPDDIT